MINMPRQALACHMFVPKRLPRPMLANMTLDHHTTNRVQWLHRTKQATNKTVTSNVVTGPGAFDFKQGDTNGTLFWKVVGHFLHNPTASQISCQAPKPILLDTGNAHIPYEWYAAAP